MVQFLIADDSSALRESVASEERSLFTLPDNQLAIFALIAVDIGRLRRCFCRQDIALLIQLQGRFAVRIVAAS